MKIKHKVLRLQFLAQDRIYTPPTPTPVPFPPQLFGIRLTFSVQGWLVFTFQSSLYLIKLGKRVNILLFTAVYKISTSFLKIFLSARMDLAVISFVQRVTSVFRFPRRKPVCVAGRYGDGIFHHVVLVFSQMLKNCSLARAQNSEN